MKAVCAILLGGISRSLKQGAERRMVLDEAKRPVFRIRLVGETADRVPLSRRRRDGGWRDRPSTEQNTLVQPADGDQHQAEANE